MECQSTRSEIPQISVSRAVLLAVAGTLTALVAFTDPLLLLVNGVLTEEYSHGFLIPVVTVWLLWLRRDALRANVGRPAWTVLIINWPTTIMHLIGEMSAIAICHSLRLW